MRAGCGFEPLSSSAAAVAGDCASHQSLRVSCLDRLSLIVEGLNTATTACKSSSSAPAAAADDGARDVAVDKLAPSCGNRAAQATHS